MKWLPVAIITALTVGLLLMAATAEGKATRIPFTSQDSPCTITSMGTWTYPDGNLHIRGLTQECVHPANIPQLVGTDYEVLNFNLDATGSGSLWLTWRLETQGGGWEGIAHGTVAGMLSAEPYGTAKSVGHGTGIYEGQHYFGEAVITAGITTATGYILVP